jgi:hypothetical protein
MDNKKENKRLKTITRGIFSAYFKSKNKKESHKLERIS